MRIIFEFGKLDRLRFISHLDLQRFMQRALRRTSLPVSYSQGFNPHPNLAFASALATGYSSVCELMDIKLTDEVDAGEAIMQMRAALPPEMPVYRARCVDNSHPSLMAVLTCADYDIVLSGEGAGEVAAMAGEYMALESKIALRKTKSGEKPADVRAMTLALEREGERALKARLMLTERATLKPDLLISVLGEMAGIGQVESRVERRALMGERDGTLVPLFDY